MGVTVYGRRAIRRFERETGERIVHAIDQEPGAILTTIDHRHLAWYDGRWVEIPQVGNCGMWLSSCHMLFGDVESGVHRGFMRGPCETCGVDCSMLHRADCAKLADLLGWRSINPDYWPKPVHRPLWIDDPRCPVSRTAMTHRLAYAIDIPPELLTHDAGPNWWGWWTPSAETVRRDVDSAVAAVAPDVLRSVGLDPKQYTLGMDWQPGPYAGSHGDPWAKEEE